MTIPKHKIDSIVGSTPRICTNETVEVWNIDSESIAGLYATAAAILLDYDSEPYSNLVTQQIDTGSGLEFNGILYVHL